MGQPAAAADDQRTRRCRRRRSGHAAVAVLLTLLLTVACTSNNPTGPADPTDAPDQTETTDEATPEPTEPETGTETETEVADEVQIGEVWSAFHTAWTDQAPAEAPDPAAFEAVAVDPQAAAGQLITQRGEARTVTTEAELWPTMATGRPATVTVRRRHHRPGPSGVRSDCSGRSRLASTGRLCTACHR